MRNAQWDDFVQQFIESTFQANPDRAVYAGRHEFDGMLPDWSADGLAAEVARLHLWRANAETFDPNSLDEQRAFEREYVLAVIDQELFWRERAQAPFRNPAFYQNSLDPNVYVSRPYASPEVRMKAYTAYARSIPIAVKQIKANLRTPMPSTFVELGKLISAGLATYYEHDVPVVFAEVENEQAQREFRFANDGAAQAMRDLHDWFAGQKSIAGGGYELGADLFSEMLWATERVRIPLDELERVGRADLERNLAALKDACTRFAPGTSVESCIEHVQKKKPPEGPVAGAQRQLAELRDFLASNDLVTIPGTEEAQVKESPPYARWNAAYIDIPGPYEKNLPSVYYIAPPDPSWTPEEQVAYISGEADLLFISVHEVWPGHFLHFLHSNRARSKFGQIFVGYAFAEGWAHYAEEMMWEAGLGKGDPELHVGQLLNALLRNVRFLTAIGLHTGTMTVEEAERMFREYAFQDPANARQQAARGTFDPACLNYTMGKLMIMKLREDWTAARGGRSAWKEFHDRLLSFGGPPIPLVRKVMVGEGGSLF